jgi:hypothetical protein
MLDGKRRWCFWLKEAAPDDIRASRELRDRIEQVRRHRLSSKRDATKELASTPALFGEIRQPRHRYICIPRHTSERRHYIPMVFAEPDVIAHDSTLTIETDELFTFGLLHSSFWMVWVRAIGGRLKGDFRISSELTYNTFPWPEKPSIPARDRVRDSASAVLEARAAHPEATLSALYDPLAMPADLVRAHRDLDRVVDRLFGRGRFDDPKRLSVLLTRYAKLSSLGSEQ